MWTQSKFTPPPMTAEQKKARRETIAKAILVFGASVIVFVLYMIPSGWVPAGLSSFQINIMHKIWSYPLQNSCQSNIECSGGYQCVYATYPDIQTSDYGTCTRIPVSSQYQTCLGNVSNPPICAAGLSCIVPSNGTLNDSGYCYTRTTGKLNDVCTTSNSTITIAEPCMTGLRCVASPNMYGVNPGDLGTCQTIPVQSQQLRSCDPPSNSSSANPSICAPGFNCIVSGFEFFLLLF
jgi:hypothetical protein